MRTGAATLPAVPRLIGGGYCLFFLFRSCFITPTLPGRLLLFSSKKTTGLSFGRIDTPVPGRFRVLSALPSPSAASRQGAVHLKRDIACFRSTASMASAEETPRRPLIGTHNGKFHLDEVLATVMLLKLPKYKNALIRRSRDPEVLAKCDIVVDVGAVYDVEKGRFDHHQKGFEHTFYDEVENGEDAGKENGVTNEHPKHSGDGEIENVANNHDTQRPRKWRRLRTPVTKLSSAGLIYKHFGKEVLKQPQYGIKSPEELDFVFQNLYTSFIEGVDAVDNGVSIVPGGSPAVYRDGTTLSSRVNRCYPPWNADDLLKKNPDSKRLKASEQELYPVEVEGGSEAEVLGFRKAMFLANEEFEDAVSSIVDIWLPAKQVVLDAFKHRFEAHPSGRVIKLSQWCPFQEHVYEIEEEQGVPESVLFCLYPDLKNNEVVGWRVYAVQEKDQQFKSRLPLSEKLRALRDEELGNAVINNPLVAGSDDLRPSDFIHCHATGFIAGTKSLPAALAMVNITMRDADSQKSEPKKE
ncbi:gamm1 protein [Cystoisospora suis]|uniref:Gamm1 protein n=1 Tax=Cystoisospora suis TaxID=483139 RepID=A0A2C6KXL8_9APIC|nr:gamm1 protein [Cystoisospora suis]